MRNQNRRFKFSIITNTDSKEENKDSVAYVELDKFACYVFTKGLEDQPEDLSAKQVVETITHAFRAHPSLKKEYLLSYFTAANHMLEKAEGGKHQKASITVVVSDYTKLRYSYIGNTKQSILKNGVKTACVESKPLQRTTDMGYQPGDVRLEQEAESSPATHKEEEARFTTFVSKKIMLEHGDILTLGMENEANHSQEDTFVMLIADRIGSGWDKKQWLRQYPIVSAIMAGALSMVILSAWLVHRERTSIIEEFNQNYDNTIEYIQDNNYFRAEKECQETLELAEKLKDKQRISEAGDCLKLIEAVKEADHYYLSGKYSEAKSSYFIAKKHSSRADGVADDYINKKISNIADYFLIHHYIKLGDEQRWLGDYTVAEENYLLAKDLATINYFPAAREEAMNALEQLYLEETYLDEKYLYNSYEEEYPIDNDIENGYVIINDEELVLEEKILMDGRISMVLPEDFQLVDSSNEWDEEFERNNSVWTYSNSDDEVALFCKMVYGVYFEEDIRWLPEYLAELIEEEYPGFVVEESGVIGEGTEVISWIAITAPPEDDSYFALAFIKAVPEGMLVTLFSCDAYVKEDWESVFFQLIATLQELEVESL